MPRHSAAYLWTRKPGCSGADQGTQKPKKTSPQIRERGCGLGPGWRGHENSYRSQPERPENEAQGFPLRLRSKKSESGTTALVDFDALPQLAAEAKGCSGAKGRQGAGDAGSGRDGGRAIKFRIGIAGS